MEQVFLVRGYAADAFVIWLALLGLLVLIFLFRLIDKRLRSYLNRKIMIGWPFE